ncbi:ATP-binding cassette domain-containing protein [candidate division KSB3 bacterium]|uniref:ATP-binding cassette domain-containing protein n=1 Tax=candidate division KSB3 bacterium TaxID=2044937 RepID=A0A9D5Q5C6_9BACT|nr:ATP-binding cassette domain-containing protein [candidate division KSB3 bacterium]MBD3324689.1 ATP-binding cassette domain-containing protein [candidate division KSB3 bacterium]
MASIRLEHVNKSFPGVKALIDITQDIASGTFFTLLGPSGCGKTTLLRTVAGFYKQDSGHVYISGELIDEIPAYRRDTGMVFQNYAVFPHMTVFENVAFGLKSRKVKTAEIKKRVARVLELARLSGYEERTPDQLSGGQQQRVGLARAMVIEPQVLLMDEPLSNLDAKLRVQMREEIRDIQRQLGITTIYVTHDQEEALVISDSIAVMNVGVIQQVGTSWEIYKESANTFVASFVGNMNFMNGTVTASHNGFIEVDVNQHTVKAAPPKMPMQTIRLAARPEDISIVHEQISEDGVSSIPGIIRKTTFTGSLVQYTVDCGEDLHLIVERHKPEYDALIPQGSSIFVKIPVNAMLLFHPETGERL